MLRVMDKDKLEAECNLMHCVIVTFSYLNVQGIDTAINFIPLREVLHCLGVSNLPLE